MRESLDWWGFTGGELTYHSVFPLETIRILQVRNDATALCVRTRADRIAVHRTMDIQFYWEAKTHVSRKWSDMCIEAYPLALHHANAQVGVRCLYIYHNPHTEQEVGFWVNQMPPIREIRIPSRWDAQMQGVFRIAFEREWPRVPIRLGGSTGGTDDPFAIIDQRELARLPHWQELITQLL